MSELRVKYTPGPWEATDLNQRGNWARVVHAVSGETIANIVGGDIPFNMAPTEEARANARLIAAAPDMLGLLEDVSRWLEGNLKRGTINAGTANRDGDLVSQIRAIIAKAKGD